MPRVNFKKSRQGRKRKRGNNRMTPSSNQSIYRGPVIRRQDRAQLDVIEVQLAWQQALTSSVGGEITDVFSNSPANGLAKWTDYRDSYSEVRVLGMQIAYRPVNRYTKVGIVCNPGVSVIDRSSSTALSALNTSMEYSSHKLRSLEDPWTEVIKMNGIGDAEFQPTLSVAANQWIKLYFPGLTNSTVYGYVYIYFLCQFRGSK